MEEVVNAGDSGRITREYFDSLLVEMRHIDACEPDTGMELYGKHFSTPIMMAALSHLNGFMDNGLPAPGMAAAAQGFHDAGALAWMGMGEDSELEEMRATGAELIKIIKPHEDNKIIFRKIEHAEKNGCLAVGMDIDHQAGDKDKWYVAGGVPVKYKSLSEIREFVGATKLPFIIKGVLSEQDAQKCLAAGVRGIVVSHHHGMTDYALPPLRILPKIAKLVNKQIPIFVDCEIKRGIDVFKALALGADAVCVGRAIMGPLKQRRGGAHLVKAYIDEMNHELKWTMAVTCCPDIRHIDPSLIWEK